MSSLSTLSSTKSEGSSDAVRAQIAPLRSDLDCDPCILRSKYKLKAVLLGNHQYMQSTSTDFANAKSNNKKGSLDGDISNTNNNEWLQIQAAMHQAARDMRIAIDVDIVASPRQMAKIIREASKADSGYSALIVTLPVVNNTSEKSGSIIYDAVKTAIHINGMPVFGMGAGYTSAQELGVISFVSQDERLAGRIAAHQFQEHFAKRKNVTNSTQAQDRDDSNFTSTQIKHAVFIHPVQSDSSSSNADTIDTVMQVRFEAFQEALQLPVQLPISSSATAIVVAKNTSQAVSSQSAHSDVQVEHLFVDAYDKVYDTVTQLNDVFEKCLADVVLLGDAGPIVDIAVAARLEHGCTRTQIGVFGDTRDVMDAIVRDDIQFCISSQLYLQSVMPVYLASVFVTTGKALALPMKEKVYLSGPDIITRDSVYTDSLQTCVMEAFPICPNQMAPNGALSSCPCTDRSAIRIGGVLHGVATDSYWDPVFANIRQAADDMGVELDLIRFEPNSPEIIYKKMSARIRSLCETGVDGIFVTIPNDSVVPDIKQCLDLGIPVISINSGGDKSVELGLLNHIGMLEYNGGYGAGERLIAAGMKIGFCPNHEPSNIAMEERCKGFADAIYDANDPEITYGGMFDVFRDNAESYAQVVDTFVNIDGDWEGVGVLCTGAPQVSGWRRLRELHPKLIGGSFDVAPSVLDLVEQGEMLFAINQNPYLQAIMPVYLLSVMAYTGQSLKNYFIETGPQFIDSPTTSSEKICETNFFSVCIEKPEEDMNYISDKLLALGYTLFTILLVLVLICLVFTIKYRTSGVIQVSQPLFGYMMLIGTVISALSIPFLGVETSHRVLQDQATGLLLDEKNPDVKFVDISCMLVPWFYGLGFAIIFSALFAKINRVRLIYKAGRRMRRQQVTIQDVLPIMGFVLAIEVGLLVLWQIILPQKWERTIINDDEGVPLESFGRCLHDGNNSFWLVIIGFHVVCLIYALILSYQTRNIVSQFSESSYLFFSVMFMFQVQVLAVPILALVRENPDAYYFVQTMGIFFQDFTVIVLIFGTKVLLIIKGESDIQLGNIAPRDISIRQSTRFSASFNDFGSRNMSHGQPVCPQNRNTNNNNNNIMGTSYTQNFKRASYDNCDNSNECESEETDPPIVLMNMKKAVQETMESGEFGSQHSGDDEHVTGEGGDDTTITELDKRSCMSTDSHISTDKN